ncbi:hypothetical protein BVRB_029320 [Beta vulgaris subsp. vulgaris]|uniref:CBS domain-containing protein n=1 Tax=Beta vulgaris subsp. vulgaris TaxID=3555 RepID=A0A0J8AY49_BETVV|nr:hypothetical protein BVRB_029320 [Beta vulgaris subsp. vulgaris]
MVTVTQSTTLERLFCLLLSSRKHACVVLDENDIATGIISLSDVFNFFINHEQDPSQGPRTPIRTTPEATGGVGTATNGSSSPASDQMALDSSPSRTTV